MNVEHDFHSLEEKRSVCRYIDEEFGLDYEITYDDADRMAGSILIFEMYPEEFDQFKNWLATEKHIESTTKRQRKA